MKTGASFAGSSSKFIFRKGNTMKKILSLVLVALMLAAIAVPAFAVETGTSYGKVPKTSDKITVDGKMDDVYKKGLAVKSLTKDIKGNAAAASFTAYLVWNGKDTIYCYAEIVDPTYFDYTKLASVPNAWSTDSLELFLDYSNKVARTRDQYRIDLLGKATYYDTKTYTNQETAPFGFEGYAAAKTEKGYAVEYQIKAYKEAIAGDMKIGFHLMLNDMQADGKTRLNVGSDECGNEPTKFGYITLSNTSVTAVTTTAATTKAPAATGSSAQTFDAGIVMAVVAAVAGAGVVVSKKKH